MTTIKEIRTACKMTQKAFAEELHIPKRTIEEWEGNRRQPPPYIIELIRFRVTKTAEKDCERIKQLEEECSVYRAIGTAEELKKCKAYYALMHTSTPIEKSAEYLLNGIND